MITSAPEAKEIIRKVKIDIVLSDIEMPEESGLELLEWIDSYDKNIVPNDIPKLLDSYKNIEKVICNGRTSQNTMQKYFPNIETVYCPSTSSANAQFSLEQLIEIYKKEFYE